MTLPTAMLFDLDGTILDDGDRRTVLLEVATEQRALLGSHDPARVANRLEDAFAAFWSDPTRHRIARFGLAEARLGVVTEVFVDLDLQPDAARAFSETFNKRRAQATTLFLGARDTNPNNATAPSKLGEATPRYFLNPSRLSNAL